MFATNIRPQIIYPKINLKIVSNPNFTGIKEEEKFLTGTQIADIELNRQLAKEGGVKNLVIIDDIIGDGDSISEYFTDEVVKSLENYEKIYFAALLKDPDGERYIKNKFPQLNIEFVSSQTIHKYDSDENTDFTPKEKQEITKLIKKYSDKISPALTNKYSRSKLFVSFDWNTPGNTPMLFNLDSEKWKSLFPRYNGLETSNVSPNF